MRSSLNPNSHSKHITFMRGSEDLSVATSSNIQSLEVDGISKKIRRFGKYISRPHTDAKRMKPSTSLASGKIYESLDTLSLETGTDIQANDSTACEYLGGSLGRRPQGNQRKATCSCFMMLRVVCHCLLGLSMLIVFSMASVTFMVAIQHCYYVPIAPNVSLDNITVSRKNETQNITNPPTFLTYMVTSGMGLMLPAVLCWPKYKSSKEDGVEKTSTTDFLFVLSQDRRDWRLALSRTLFLSCLWLAYVYSLIRSLQELPLIDCVVIICTSPCYLYLFSWIILHKRFLASRIVAFVISSCGTILLIYLDQKLFGSKVLATFAVVTQAFFTVIRRGIIGGSSIFRNASFYTTIGIFCCLFTWPIVICTSVVTSAEEIHWDHFPWTAFSIAFLAFQAGVLVQEISSPVHSTVIYRLQVLGLLPLSFVVEVYRNGIEMDLHRARIASILLVVIGALLTAVPLKVYKKIRKWFNRSNKAHIIKPPFSSDRRASSTTAVPLHKPSTKSESGHELDPLKVSAAARSLLTRPSIAPEKTSRPSGRSRFLGVIYQNTSDASLKNQHF
nr:unnamed protein product [Spirometra erinaceieuropaei]